MIYRETNASCGDEIEVQLQVERITNYELRITNFKWCGRGCAISMAAASLLSESVTREASSVKNIQDMTDRDMTEMLGGEISSARMRCATLALTALRKAVSVK